MAFATVLIVDDNPTDTLLLRYAIEASGIPAELICVSSGDAARAYVRQKEAPDLIVLDFLLGRETGLDVLNTLSPALRTKTVLLSGMMPARVGNAIGASDVRCFQKPGDLEGWFTLAKHLSPFVAEFVAAA